MKTLSTLINELPLNDSSPATVCKIVEVLKAMETELVADEALQPEANPPADAPLATATIASTAIIGFGYIMPLPNGNAVPAVVTLRHSHNLIDIIAAPDGVNFNHSVSSVTQAASPIAATPGQAFVN